MVRPALRQPWAFLQGYQVLDEHQVLVERLRIVQTPWGGLYLHRIYAEDAPGLHGHPWWFVSMVICGQYSELVVDGDRSIHREHFRFHPKLMRMHCKHRITHLHGIVWTLVLAGPYHPDWGARWQKSERSR